MKKAVYLHTQDGYFTYSHNLRPGVNRDSHALKVAQLARMPESAVTLAKRVSSALGGQQHLDGEQLALLGSTTVNGMVST